MAKVIGKAGQYVEDQSIRKNQRSVLICLVAIAICGLVSGFFLAASVFRWGKPWLSIPVLLAIAVVIYFGNKWFTKKVDVLDRERIAFRKGAVGEGLIAGILEGLPDGYTVLNDLTTPSGNLDHVVVGPNGIFVIDTKNWKGTVTSDGNGELLLNGKPTTKPEVKNLVRTVMAIRERITAVCQREYFIKAILAFPTARVEARWGSIKTVDCVTDEALTNYITQHNSGSKLSAQEIDRVARAFSGLAKMDSEVK